MPKSMPVGPAQPHITTARPPRRTLRVLLAMALALWVAAAPSTGFAQPLRVLTTTAMIADMVQAVGGPCVESQALMGPGIDPHLYRASAGDVDRLARAQWIIHHGLGLEGQLGAVLARFGERTPTLALGDAIAHAHPAAMLRDGEGGPPDPHLWLDAELWSRGIDIVQRALTERAPDCHGSAQRADELRNALLALHEWAQQSTATIPPAQRVLVTSHDAFGYFGRAYGLAVHGIEGISTESEASIGDIRATTEIILERRLPAIFVETTLSPRTVEAVQAAARAASHTVAIAGPLYGDAMGAHGTPEGTLIGMLRYNVNAITRALGGTPARWPEALSGWGAAESTP